MLRDALRAPDSLAMLVDTIVVQPESVTLHVGDTLITSRALTIEARTAEGNPLQGVIPGLRIENFTIAEHGGGGVIAKRPGITRLIIYPVDPSNPRKDPRTRTAILIQVVP